MDVRPVGPRDARWEEDEPSYRVYLWQRQVDHPTSGWASEEWRITGAEAPEVLAWAREQAHGRLITVWVEHRNEVDGFGLIRLQGWEPTRTDAPQPHAGCEKQH